MGSSIVEIYSFFTCQIIRENVMNDLNRSYALQTLSGAWGDFLPRMWNKRLSDLR